MLRLAGSGTLADLMHRRERVDRRHGAIGQISARIKIADSFDKTAVLVDLELVENCVFQVRPGMLRVYEGHVGRHKETHEGRRQNRRHGALFAAQKRQNEGRRDGRPGESHVEGGRHTQDAQLDRDDGKDKVDGPAMAAAAAKQGKM